MSKEIDFNVSCWYMAGCHLYRKDCHKTCHRYLEMNYLITNCGLPNASKYIKPIVPTAEDEPAFNKLLHIKENVLSFVSAGRNLYITSVHLRNGKTTWALKIMYKYFDLIWAGNGFRVRGYFLHVPDFLTKLKTFSYKETTEYKNICYVLENADLVIWDDISATTLSANEQNLLNSFISKRNQNDKANIFTGYSKNEKLQMHVGELLAQRITNDYIVEFVSPAISPEISDILVRDRLNQGKNLQ